METPDAGVKDECGNSEMEMMLGKVLDDDFLYESKAGVARWMAAVLCNFTTYPAPWLMNKSCLNVLLEAS